MIHLLNRPSLITSIACIFIVQLGQAVWKLVRCIKWTRVFSVMNHNYMFLYTSFHLPSTINPSLYHLLLFINYISTINPSLYHLLLFINYLSTVYQEFSVLWISIICHCTLHFMYRAEFQLARASCTVQIKTIWGKTPKWTIEPLLVKLCDVKNISNVVVHHFFQENSILFNLV